MIAKFIKSMGYAINGIKIGIKEERNIRIDIVAAFYVMIFSKFYNLTLTQNVLLVIICCGVIALELMNTAIERAVDKPDSEHYRQAGEAKDAAAGSVLVAAVGAVAVGIMLFWDLAVFKEIFDFFISRPIMILCLAVTFFASYKFITLDKNKG